jgi:ABC-type transporter Mla MlaB component
VDDYESPAQQLEFSAAAAADVATSTVHARGELDRLTVDLLWSTIDVLICVGRYRITLDLADVSGIDAQA